MQWCGLPGLRKHKKGLDSAKKMATEYAYVLSVKKKKKRKRKIKIKRKQRKRKKLAGLR